PGWQHQEGRGRQGRDRADRQGTPPAGRLVHPLRRERGCPSQGRRRPARHADLRTGGPGTAREAIHADHLPCSGGAVTMRIKKGDTVIVTAGKDKGVTGKVIAAYPRQRKVLVEGVNRITKHVKPVQTARGSQSGGLVHQEAPVDVSNVMLAVEV